LNGIAGLRAQRRNRTTGTLVGLYDGEPAGMDTEGGRWQTVCEDHGTICSHETMKVAESFLSHPQNWCEDCSAIEEAI
jgi:hypothetical protein